MFLIHSDVLVIGGSAAGLAAAITARRQYPAKKVSLIRRADKVPIPAAIPYVLGTLASPDDNLFAGSLLEENGVKVFTGEAARIDRGGKLVELANGDTIGYERLVLATGSRPAILPVPGFDLDRVFTIEKDLESLRRLRGELKDIGKLAIIGGGFIGVEVALECRKAGVGEVTIVEQRRHCLAGYFDEEFCCAAEGELTSAGIHLQAGLDVKEFKGQDKVEGVVLSNGYQLAVEAVIFAIGSVPDAKLAKVSGLKLGPTGGVDVDRNMQTSDPRIFAAGDCAEKVSFFGGKPLPVKLASIACAEARIAGANLFGLRREHPGTIGAWATVAGRMPMAAAGLGEAGAREQGYDCVAGICGAPNRHPEAMPGAERTTVKLVFERRTGVLLGAQVMGGPAVCEMINMLSVCIQQRMTFDDIATFQFGTHPALSGSPLTYQTVVAAELALESAVTASGGK
jgi:pyruvate/2-oxoglutarate dehydrogenase complex dihydrolipoamide dehydrogenase (E3) component